MTNELENILQEVVRALNELPNKRLQNNKYKNTYQLVADLKRIIDAHQTHETPGSLAEVLQE
jgi:hypothetical protein